MGSGSAVNDPKLSASKTAGTILAMLLVPPGALLF